MSTRANIKFQDGYSTYYIDKSHDGYPENILKDIEDAVRDAESRYGNEVGQLISLLISRKFDPEKKRLSDYEIIDCIPGDTKYCYFVKWNCKEEKFEYGIE